MQDRPTQSSREEQKAKLCRHGDVDFEQIVGVLLLLICEGGPHRTPRGVCSDTRLVPLQAFVMSSHVVGRPPTSPDLSVLHGWVRPPDTDDIADANEFQSRSVCY